MGSFYARFGGKEDLLEYLGERVWHEATERWDEALASRDWSQLELAELAEGSVRLLSDAQRSRSSYLRALDRASGGNDEAYGSFRRHLLTGIEEILLSRASEIEHDDPALAVRVGLRAVMGVIDAELDQEAPLTPDRLVDEATGVLLGYLTPRERSASGTADQVDFFDIWG